VLPFFILIASRQAGMVAGTAVRWTRGSGDDDKIRDDDDCNDIRLPRQAYLW
jgi:hypothetical protein